jgi:D,D-heptose 1,7-bisphosphate phosphatase
MNKAAFFDRDGTINVEVNYLYKIEDFKFIDGVPELIKSFNDSGFKVIVITNQAGIARGFYTENDMHKLHKHINRELSKFGARIDAFYFCPHHPDFTGECKCRKPKAGMIEKAIKDFDIDVSKSILLGDKSWDIEAGAKCGIQSYYIDSYMNNIIM